jgi:hypothetical protein
MHYNALDFIAHTCYPFIMSSDPAVQPQLDNLNASIASAAAQLQQTHTQEMLQTEAWRRLRQGKFGGPDGIDAVIVALQGGTPLDFTPSFP